MNAEFERYVKNYPILVSLVPCGRALSVNVRGGDRAHIGSVTVAQNGEILSRWLGDGHRDNVVGDKFAKALSEHTGALVSVTCGIHYERFDRVVLSEIILACDELLEEIIENLKG